MLLLTIAKTFIFDLCNKNANGSQGNGTRKYISFIGREMFTRL